MKPNPVKNISALDVPLSKKLELLREAAANPANASRLKAWGKQHLALHGKALNDWTSRAWWGLAAGELLREHLYNEQRRPAVLELIDPPDWTAINEAQQHGGIILATAHIGPPRAAMNYLIDCNLPLLIWTNMQGVPGWLPRKTTAKFLDPLFAEERAVLLIKSALHLRAGGVLFGAPDWASGTRTVALPRLGVECFFSLGIPMLVRQLRLPAFLVMALWHGERIQLTSIPIYPPDFAMAADEWNRLWIERYWGEIEPIIRSSPENLRFLRTVDGGALVHELQL